MYRRILVPLDNGPGDDVILAHIRQLAQPGEVRLTLTYVADGYGARYQQSLNLADSEEMRAGEAYLARRAADLAAAGYQVDWRLEKGSPATRILALIEETGADLVAMATHGHGFILDILLGSVASDVRHKSPVPVLLVPGGRAAREKS